MAAGTAYITTAGNGNVGYYVREGEAVLIYSNLGETKEEIVHEFKEIEYLDRYGRKDLKIKGRQDARVRTNIMLTLPNDMDNEKCMQHVKNIINKTPIKDCKYIISIHKGESGEVKQNKHVHIIYNERNTKTNKKDRRFKDHDYFKKLLVEYKNQFGFKHVEEVEYKRDRIKMEQWKSDPDLANKIVKTDKIKFKILKHQDETKTPYKPTQQEKEDLYSGFFIGNPFDLSKETPRQDEIKTPAETPYQDETINQVLEIANSTGVIKVEEKDNEKEEEKPIIIITQNEAQDAKLLLRMYRADIEKNGNIITNMLEKPILPTLPKEIRLKQVELKHVNYRGLLPLDKVLELKEKLETIKDNALTELNSKIGLKPKYFGKKKWQAKKTKIEQAKYSIGEIFKPRLDIIAMLIDAIKYHLKYNNIKTDYLEQCVLLNTPDRDNIFINNFPKAEAYNKLKEMAEDNSDKFLDKHTWEETVNFRDFLQVEAKASYYDLVKAFGPKIASISPLGHTQTEEQSYGPSM